MGKLPDLDLGEFGGQALPDLDLAEFAAPTKEPERNLLGAVSDVGKLVYDVPTQAMAAVGNLAEEDDPSATHDWRDRWREAGVTRTEERKRELGDKAGELVAFGVNRGDIADASGSTGFSLASMGAGLLGGVAGAPIPVPGASAAGFLGASGAAAYKMDKTMFTANLIDAANKALVDERGSAMTPIERSELLKKTANERQNHALWEAGPEAIGNLLTASGVGSIFKGVSKKVVGKIVGGLAKMYGGELATETVTQMGQQQAESDVGLTPDARREWTSSEDWGQSFKEVYPQTMVLSTLMGGGGAVAGKAADMLSRRNAQAQPGEPQTVEPLPPQEVIQPSAPQPPQEKPSTFQEFSDFADSVDAELTARRNTLAAPTNFGQVDEFANLVQQEKADVEAQRGLIAQRQTAQRESSLESADARVEGQRIAETRTGRLGLLDEVYASGDRTPGMTFLKKLESEYPNQPLPTPEEKAIIASRESAYQAYTKPDIEPSLPNELVMPEPAKPKQGEKFDRSKLIHKLLSTKGNRVKGDAIVNKDGKPILKSVTQDELTGAQQYGQSPQVPTAGLDTGIAPIAGRAEPAGVLAADGSGRMPAAPVAIAGQDRAVPLPGVGDEALEIANPDNLFLTIGSTKYGVANYKQASEMVFEARKEMRRRGISAKIGFPEITNKNGKVVAHVGVAERIIKGDVQEKGAYSLDEILYDPIKDIVQEDIDERKIITAQPQGERNALQKQEAQAAEAVIPATTNTKTAAGEKPLKIGKNALSASVVEIDPDGVVVIVEPDGERNQAQDYDTGDLVKVKPGSSNNEIYQALVKANALQGGHKAFNLEKAAKKNAATAQAKLDALVAPAAPEKPLHEIKVIAWAINLKDSKGTPVFEIPPLQKRVEFRVTADEAVAELDADISKLEKMRVCLNG